MTHRRFMTALCAAVLAALPLTAQAQDTYIDTDATINTALPERLYVANTTTDPITVDLVAGGSVGSNATIYKNATFNIAGGSIGNNLGLLDQSVLNFTSGTIVSGGIQTFGSNLVTISGGSVGRGVVAGGTSLVNISGGEFSTIGGYDIAAGDDAVLNFTGGNVNGRGYASGNGILNILGGAFTGDLQAVGNLNTPDDEATINLRGGTFGGDLIVNGANAIVNLYGTNLAFINPTPVLAGTQYDLLGNLEDGTSLVGRNLIINSSGGVVNIIPTGGPTAAPEPGTLALMALALIPAVGIIRRRS